MSLNDPQWGKRGGGSGGPPDLDEIWRGFTRRLNELFSRGGGGDEPPGGGSGPGAGMAMSGIVMLIMLGIIVWLASGFYIVDEGRRGVVLRFGLYRETTTPGLRWHLPTPIEGVEIVNASQVNTVEIGYRSNVKSKELKESLMLTEEQNIIDIQFAVQYTIKNPEDYLFKNRSTDQTVRQVGEAAIRETVGKSKMDFALYEGRQQIAAETEKLMQQILDRYSTGILVSKVTLQNAQPPEQVQAAFDDAIKASQDRDRLINEGQAYANDIVPKASGVGARLLQEASGYSAKVVAQAEGDASRFRQILVEYAKAPGVTRDRLYLDMMQSVLGNTSKVLVDQKSAGGSLLYLPLDKLLHGAEPGASVAPSEMTRPPAAEVPMAGDSSASRGRDSLRSRERETR
jgi:membrane protease subunit HflK